MAKLNLQGLGKTYANGARAVQGVTLDIADGEFVVLVGPSGCGKSTTLRMIAGLETIDEGRLLIGGRDVTHTAPADRGVAMVFQSYALYPHMTVEDNLGFALKLARVDAAERRRRVQRAAETLQLGALLGRLPRELSGGQRQRVAIGRAIVREPGVFLFDEPLSNLDAALRTQMRLELAQLHERLGTTVVYVTHDQVEAMTLGQRIAVFNAGRVEQVGTPMAIYRAPANRFVAGFVGSPRMNLLPSVLRQHEGSVVAEVAGGAGRLPLPPGTRGADGTPCEAGVRPEHLHLGAEGEVGGLPAQVERVESLGDAAWVHCRVPGVEQPLCVRADPEAPLPRARSACRLLAAAAHVHLFDPAGRALA